MEPCCKNTKCFANLRGKCYALIETDYDKTGKCEFFKMPKDVDHETMRRIYPRPDKFHVDYSITGKMNKTQFEKWFKGEWNDITLYLLANHREEISKIPITLEL